MTLETKEGDAVTSTSIFFNSCMTKFAIIICVYDEGAQSDKIGFTACFLS